MTRRTRAAEAVTRALGSPLVERGLRPAWRRGVRVLALHGVADVAAFEALVTHLAEHYRPVAGEEVLAARAGASLPPGAVWLTFDDGHPSVVEDGLPVLQRHGVPATLYVCPGLVEAGEPGWWDVVLAAGEEGTGAEVEGTRRCGPALVRALKAVPDEERRRVVDEVRGSGGRARPVASEAQLERWVEAGMELGNHTWDHPLLHRSPPEHQVAQVARAHDWLLERWGPAAVATAAYPNGDHTPTAEQALRDRGYRAGLLFDHRIARLDRRPLRTSRLRLDADADMGRVRAVVGGAHPAAFHAGARLAALAGGRVA
ncbi:polysaccharide deacetylase family protein [Iamia majanohamensis]|uniref:Polysaccharide deacetylase family protein n=1 Tax=Iamia majanohamensis TaxID=467976 RepID=A0AAF0BUX9_9ACTN|nr:polysaccharide deacetylase family protein [Iamia majanohamensis]WCO65859.1 polysaccharide deacetylase family protein [Iamia majanohamensis]